MEKPKNDEPQREQLPIRETPTTLKAYLQCLVAESYKQTAYLHTIAITQANIMAALTNAAAPGDCIADVLLNAKLTLDHLLTYQPIGAAIIPWDVGFEEAKAASMVPELTPDPPKPKRGRKPKQTKG